MSPSSDEIVAAARAWLGTPYRHRAAVLGAGCDCLGLLRGVWRTLYGGEPLAVPNYRADWRDPDHNGALRAAAEQLLDPVAGTPLPGHIVLFALQQALGPRHCGIVVAPGRFLHAQEGIGVIEANLGDSWQRRLAGVYAFPQRETR